MRMVSLSIGFASAILCAASGFAFAEQTDGARPSRVKQESAASKSVLGQPAVFRGTLGDMQVQASIRPKEVAEDGIEGEYFIFGRSQRVLLAGEMEGEDVFLEESENGTSISGQWEGKLDGDSIRGTWMSPDGSVNKPFHLKLVSTRAKPTLSRKSPSASRTGLSTNR